MKEELSTQHIDVRREPAGAPPVPDRLMPDAGTVVAPNPEEAGKPEMPSSMPAVTEVSEPATSASTEDDAAGSGEPVDPLPLPHVGGGHRHPWLRRLLWITPAVIVLLAVTALAVPVTRYRLLAYVLKRDYAVTVMDSKTGTPVSGARVMLDGSTQTTGSTGKANFHARVGSRALSVTMKYYQSSSIDVFVGVSTVRNSITVQLNATGRQVPVTVINKITGNAVANATIKVLDTSAYTDSKGKATIVLPTVAVTQAATITASGYSETSVRVQVTDQVVTANTFSIVPAGQVYFLSNLSGKIDVVSTNLDGSNRSTVLAGTGNEDATYTVLLASRDWRDLALLSRRDGGTHAKLFLVSPATGKATVMDTTAADYTPIGWSGHTFVYEAAMYAANPWQSGQTVLRSYNADTGKVTDIDQTTAVGTQSSYIYSYIGYAQIVNGRVLYGFGWTDFNSNYAPSNLGGQKISMMSASVDGTAKTDLRDVAIPNGTTYAYTTALLQTPQSLAIETAVGSQPGVFYTYQYQNNTVTQSNTITAASFEAAQQSHVAYLLSPSGGSSVWGVVRDGKNTLYVGDANANNSNAVSTQSDYGVYGWYSDDYLLVQKGGSELDIMSATGGTPQKVSNYFRSSGLISNNLTAGYGGV